MVESSREQRPRATQDAYMDVGGRTTQETKSSSCRVKEVSLIDLLDLFMKTQIKNP